MPRYRRLTVPRPMLILLSLIALMIFGLAGAPVLAADNNINWNELGHNSRDPLYRYPQGAVATGTPVTLRFRALDGDLTQAQVRVWNDRVNVSTVYDLTRVASGVTLPGDPTVYEFWEVTLPTSAVSTVYWYRFIAKDGTATAYYEDDDRYTGGWGTTYAGSPDRGWQLTHFDAAFQTPDWVKNAVIYQIFVDRFRDGNAANNPAAGGFFYGANDTIVRSNGTDWNTRVCDPRVAPGSTSVCNLRYSQNFYGGDLQGVIDQLDYLDSLGVTALYLNPIFESPSNHKYDTTDFMQIDDNFGTLATFQTLAAQAETRGIRLILDGVFNHTSSDSIYFDRYGRFAEQGACETSASPYLDWFPFKPYTGTATAPCSDNRDYNYWFGIFDSLPVLDHDNAEVREYFLTDGTASVAPYWMQWADGWRLDVAPEIDHGTLNDPADDYMETLRAAVRAVNPDTYIVGEEWGNSTSWTIDNQWDATMNYQYSSAFLSFFRDENFVDNDHNGGSSAGVLSPITPTQFNDRILNWQERYAPEAYQAMMNLLGSHDTSRALFMLDHNTDTATTATYNDPAYDWSDALARLRGVTIAQFTMPGAPTIYYGDEVGTINPPAWDGSQWQDDPYNRVPYPWLDQTGTPYYTHMGNTSARSSLLSHYQTLTAARNAHPALRTGDLIPLVMDDAAGVYAYLRWMPDDSDVALVILNNGAAAASVTVDLSGYTPNNATWNELFTSASFTATAEGLLTVTGIPVNSGAVLFPAAAISGRPAAISDLTGSPASGQASLNWSDVPGATAYRILRSPLSYGGYSEIGTSTTSEYVDSGLTNAVRYWYTVVPVAGNGLEGGESNEISVIPAINLGGSGVWFNLQWPYEINHILNAGNPTPTIYGQIWIQGVTDAGSATAAPGIRAQVGYGPEADAPSSESWTWFDMAPSSGYDFAGQNNDEYSGTMLPTATGTFKYTTRYSADNGATWYYTDRNAPPYDVADAGTLTVTASSDTTAPAVPTNLAVTGTTSVSILLGWDAHPNTDGDLYGFRIYRAPVTADTVGAFAHIATVTNPAATTYADASVTSGGVFEYYVSALDTSFNESAPSTTARGTAEMREVTVTFRVTVPAGSPGTVYIVGNFGAGYPQWNPAGMAMTQVSPGVWEREFTLLDGTQVEYKYTRGSWDTVEKEADGNAEVNNRRAAADYGTTGEQLVENTVANWRDPIVVSITPANSTSAQPNTTLVAVWNQAMNEGSVEDAAGFTVTGPSGAVAGSAVYDSTTMSVTFTPSAALAPGLYTISISGRQDAGGDTQQAPHTSTFGVDFHDLSQNAWFNLQWPYTIDLVLGNTSPTVYGQIWKQGVTDASSSAVTTLRGQVGYGPAGDPPSAASWTWFDMAPNSGYDFGQNNDEHTGTFTPTASGTFKFTTRWSGNGGGSWFYTDRNGPPYDANDAGTLTVADAPPLMVEATFRVTVPTHTPDGEIVHLVGSFGGAGLPNWDAGAMPMTEVSPNVFEITITVPNGYTAAYKYTRGSWDEVEKQADGNSDTSDRPFTAAYGTTGEQLVTDTVANWRDPYITLSVPENNGIIPYNGTISVQWNQAMNEGSVEDAAGFTVTRQTPDLPAPIAGAIAYDPASMMVTFTPTDDLMGGTYNVAIAGRQDAGGDNQQVAFALTFTVPDAPATPTLIAPTGTLGAAPTQFSWNAVPGATWYYLWIGNTNGSHVLDQWVEAASVCAAEVCTATVSVTMLGGVYDWFVQSWNALGGYSAWSGGMRFTIGVAPGLTTPIAPLGTITSGTPTFQFTEVPDAAWYYIWVSGPDGYVMDRWYEKGAICAAGTCSVTPGLNLFAGAYRWWVQAWSTTGGYGQWAGAFDFTVSVAHPAPTPIAPIGISTGTPVTYTWQRVPGASWYYLWVSLASGPKMIDRWYAAADLCTGNTCSVTPGLAYRTGDQIRWWIQAWSSAGGYSPWSSETRFTVGSSGGGRNDEAPMAIGQSSVTGAELLSPDAVLEGVLPEGSE